eukprot:UN04623
MMLTSLLQTPSTSLLLQTPTSLLQTPQTSLLQLQTPPKQAKSKCKNKQFKLFLPKLCGIDEDTALESQAANISIEKQLSPNAVEFIPTKTPKTVEKTYKKISKFIPKHKPRAKLNIYIGKPETKQILNTLYEPFANTSTLYYYLDVTTALQMTDNQMYKFQTQKQPIIVFINCDLHKKQTHDTLYGVVLPNNNHNRHISRV